MQIIYMLIGTIMLIGMIVLMISGSKYNSMFENLSGDDYPLTSVYSVGAALNGMSIFSLKGKNRDNMITQARLLFEPKYAEYYATVIWIQALSFVYIFTTVGFLLAGIMNSMLMLIVMVAFGVVFAGFFMNRMSEKLTTREQACKEELPEIISTLALLINAGMMLREAWRVIADSKEGIPYELMRNSCVDMENGMSDIDAIHKFGRYTNCAEVRKFTSALAQSLERGGGELNEFLGRQSTEMWVLKKQTMLQKGESAATKLLMPTSLLFVAIIIAVIVGALGMLI